ncbi:MAG TPA: flagellar biosynthetic protein FliR [Dissulfurispiraceae bacterium]|nr:flagellar biosynthetic protein FliR [Dissulfurispiraceae bacterium]
MELYNLINIYADKFIPVFIRVAVILSFIPFIGAQQTPVMIRAGLALAFTLLLLPVVKVNTDNPARAIFEAFFVGVAMGLTARIILGAIDMAAQWISVEMGLTVAAVFNPLFQETLGPVSLLYTMLSMTLFFLFDVHYYFIEGIVRSFDITSINYNGVFSSVIKLNAFFFPLAFKIAAPVLVVQVLTNLAMGFLSKTIPQANIFFVSMPLLIVLGLVFMILSMPVSIAVISKAFTSMKDTIMVITR